jgi:hypothetical protein
MVMQTRAMSFSTRLLLAGSLLVVAVLVGTAAWAQDADEGLPGDWLTRYGTARTVGLGGAFVASADDALGALWNPAGINHLLQNQARFETASLFGESRVNGFSFALPGSSFPSVGITVVSMNSGEFERTNELNDSLGSFSNTNTAFLLTAGKKLSRRVSLGASLKMVRQSLEEFDGGGVGVDLGLLFDMSPHWRAGLAVLNAGGPSVTMDETSEDWPVELRGGLMYRALGGRARVAAELDHRSGPGALLRLGSEVTVLEHFQLRAGLAESRFGGGFSYAFDQGLTFDYGAHDHELGLTHRFGLRFDFGGFYASSQARPEIFSPSGEKPVTRFELKARTRESADQWNLKILDKHDQTVRRFGGPGMPPAHITWDGTNESGMPLPDGSYRYRLRVTDAEGIELYSNERVVRIATEGPQGEVPVVIR